MFVNYRYSILKISAIRCCKYAIYNNEFNVLGNSKG